MSKRKKKVVPDKVMESEELHIPRHESDVVMEVMEDMQIRDMIRYSAEELVEHYPILCKEIDNAVAEIVEIVAKHKPLPLLNRAYNDMLIAHLNIKTESAAGMYENITWQWLIYLQNVITSTLPDNDQAKIIEEEDYTRLFKLFVTMRLKLQIEYPLCDEAKQKKDGAINEDMAEIDNLVRSSSNSISGKQFLYLHPEILYKLLSPHDAKIQELFDINAKEFVKDMRKIQKSTTMGMGYALNEFREFCKKHAISDESIKHLLGGAVSKRELSPQLAEILEKIRGNDLFDLQKVTNLPTKLLEALSFSVGEDKEFMNKDEQKAGWPLKHYPSQLKPFLKVDGRYYCFHPHNITDHIYRTLNKVILNAEPSYRDKWQIKQGKIGEEYTFDLFAKLLPGAEIYRNVEYKWHPNKNKSKKTRYEADGIIIIDDNLFIVEVKSGAFSPYTSLEKLLKDLVEKPYTQAQRLYEYLKEHKNGAPLFDDKNNRLIDIRLSDYRRITICCLTLDQVVELGEPLDVLKKIGTDIDIKRHAVWMISIDDLRVYADLIQSPLVFCHYLEKRHDALTKLSNLNIADELDYYGIYLECSDYVRGFGEHAELDRIQFFGFRDKIDAYYYDLWFGKQPSPPSQEIVPLIKQIIEIADSQQKPGRCRMVSALLDLPLNEQNGFSGLITNNLIHQKTTGIGKIISFSGSAEIAAICEQDGVGVGARKNIKEHALASMIHAKSDHIHLIELKFTENGDVYDVDYTFLESTDIDASNRAMVQEIAYAQVIRHPKTKRKIGRNEPCPCGSGKKYKKCHGR